MDRSLGMDQSFGDKSSSDDSQSEAFSSADSLNNSIQPSGSRNLKSIMQKPSKPNSKTTPSNARQQSHILDYVTPPNPSSLPNMPRNNPSQFLQRRERLKSISEENEQFNPSQKRPKSLRDQRKLRFREPVDDRSPEPNNNQAVNSFEEDLPTEPIPTIDMDIPTDPTGNQIEDISNLKTKEVDRQDIDKQLVESIVAKANARSALLELKARMKKTMDQLYKASDEEYAKEVVQMASIEKEEGMLFV